MDRPDVQFESLFRTHHPAVAAYARRRAPAAMVDDVVNQTFLVAWRRFENVPADPLPWLLAVAANVLATQLRGGLRRDALRARLSREPQPEAPAEPDLAESALARALASLSPRDREAITLIAWDDLTPAQAAAALGEPGGAFRTRLHRARQRLRAALENEMTEVPDAR